VSACIRDNSKYTTYYHWLNLFGYGAENMWWCSNRSRHTIDRPRVTAGIKVTCEKYLILTFSSGVPHYFALQFLNFQPNF